ncbi:MAG: polysaccharide pyruvyl transferase family protein [bacterium]
MKILVVNLHSSANAGDHVLTEETVRQLNEAFSGASITLAMNDPASYEGPAQTVGSFMTWFKPGNRWRRGSMPVLFLASVAAVLSYRIGGLASLRLMPRRLRPLLRAYFEADLVVSSAGNFLYSSGRLGLPFIIAIYTMAYALLARKRLYNMPQTVGPLRRGWEKWLVRRIVSRMPLFLVRDDVSRRQLDEIGAWHDGCRLVPDLAFALPRDSRARGQRLLQRSGVRGGQRPALGITLINWGAQNRHFTGQEAYESAVAAAARTFVNAYGGRCVLFAQVRGPSEAEDDRIPARRVRDRLADLGEAVVMVEEEATAAELKAAYGCMDLFMGTRLHSNIFALTEHVPAITIQYQPKTRGVLRMLGLEEWVIEIEEVDEERLRALLDRLWQERETLERYLQTRLDPIVAEAVQCGQLIADHFAAR